VRCEQRLEGHKLRAAERLAALDEVGQGKAVPGDDHRPGLDAAHAVDALLERKPLLQLVDVDAEGLLHQPLHRHGPGPRLEGAGVLRGVRLVRAELVEVVVVGDGLVLGGRLLGAVAAKHLQRSRLGSRSGLRFGRTAGERQEASSGAGRGDSEERGVFDEFATSVKERLGRNLGAGRRGSHGVLHQDGREGVLVTVASGWAPAQQALLRERARAGVASGAGETPSARHLRAAQCALGSETPKMLAGGQPRRNAECGRCRENKIDPPPSFLTRDSHFGPSSALREGQSALFGRAKGRR